MALQEILNIDEHVEEIRQLAKKAYRYNYEIVVEIGRRLTIMRSHPKFNGRGDGWADEVRDSFGWTDETARNMMNVYELQKDQHEESAKLFGQLPLGAVYLLAKPSTPVEAKQAVAARVAAGKRTSRHWRAAPCRVPARN
jgi:hypothetical protein